MICRSARRRAVAIGLFDGIHAGHMALIHDIECQTGLKSLVYTFDTKPNHTAYKNIYTAEEKASIFASPECGHALPAVLYP